MMSEGDADIKISGSENSAGSYIRRLHREYLEKIGMTEDEYEKMFRPYIAECREITKIAKKYKNKAKKLAAGMHQNAVSVKKSIGGEIMHRGFYNPSTVEDIIIGNCKRGRLCREDDPKASFTYYFDSEDRLIGAKYNNLAEYISYQDGKSLGIEFDAGGLCDITLCEYDEENRIKSYALFTAYCDDEIEKCQKETYTYEENKLIVERASFLLSDPMLLSVYRYVFTVKDGYLCDYVVDTI